MTILEIDNVSYRYKNTRENILEDVNQTFESGQFYAIIGASVQANQHYCHYWQD